MLPTVEELLQSDLIELVDMLARQSVEYPRLNQFQGKTEKTKWIKELILRI